mmetsp:Transcript_9948/g.29866  ORF Transcript_9948/g.29866 Transcript_9948/m.29866 type:complete len:425 (+) Transcript_9948:2589-3863(+)
MRTPWCSSYLSRRPRKMEMVSMTEGSCTSTCWNRRSRAGSFSMYFRNSSRVVAPMHRSSPRPSIGFNKLPASMEPSEAPAPTTVWISSMNRMMPPSLSVTSLITAFNRSSNSPRYLAPAIRAPMSSAQMVLFWSASGTSLSTIRCAKPSTTAVFPTPGSPIRQGLFLVRLLRIWIARLISSSLPMTGSSLPSRAATVRSRPYLANTSYFPSGSLSVTRLLPRTCLTASNNRCRSRPSPWRAFWPNRESSRKASNRCSTLTNSSPNSARVSWALPISPSRFRPKICEESPLTRGCFEINDSVASSRAVGLASAFVTTRRTIPLGCSSSAFIKCSVSTICCEYCFAISGAATIACHAFSVNSFWLMRFPLPAPSARTIHSLLPRLLCCLKGGPWTAKRLLLWSPLLAMMAGALAGLAAVRMETRWR